ncbi:Alpha/Beta hydrolase protein [Diaporthe sp. PMI_573]|nr:Alpha/Beta hydrolase protein [Diaporthaceae sp. PMI_573]
MSPAWHICAAGLVSLAHAALFESVVDTKFGSVQGYPAFNATPDGVTLQNWKDITVWKGIPFAASSGGNNRFRAPQPATPWNKTLDAGEYGDICPEALTRVTDGYTVSEDCLNLNIWSAANSSDAKLPVVMWSYPAQSTARDALFDGAGMADEGVVFVNYNYRSGVFGWLAHPWLSAEMNEGYGANSSGNWAMLDQFAALKWIHENIEAFGGDPDRITVMGQSGGSAATYHITNSPLTKGLIGYRTLDTALATGEDYVSEMNITSLSDLRALDYSDLAQGNDFGAVLDYYAMPDTYMNTLLKGAANDVPIMTGNTRDESGATYGLNITLETYLEEMNETFGDWEDEFLNVYAANDSASASAAYNAQWSDRSAIGTWLWAGLWGTASSNPVYSYFWDHAPPGQNQGAYHESEINYVLNNLYATDKPWTAEDYSIAETMNAYWVSFIKTGNPNTGNLTYWSPTSNASQTVQHVGDGWGQMPVSPRNASVGLFGAWYEALTEVY